MCQEGMVVKMSEEKKDVKEISKQLVEAAGKKGSITYAEIIDMGGSL